MRHWIFSYGSLAHKDVAEKTGKTLNYMPAVLRDHSRNFRVLVRGRGFAAAGIEMRRGQSVIGMLIEVPEVELTKFDTTEHLYHRREIRPDLVSVLEGDMPEGIFYLYVPNNPQAPTQEVPLVQSYLDVILEAFLEYDEEIITNVISSMLDLERPWLNDRMMPRYYRYLEGVNTERIDALLKHLVPDQFAARVEDPMASHIKEELAEAILKAVAFFDLFDFPMQPEEIMDHLYRYNQPVHIKEVRATLDYMVRVGLFSELKGYYVFAGREMIIETRRARKFIAEKFWNRTKLYGTYMRSVPFVEMIAVCNNLAYDNASDQSDIDLFIVVRPGRMWLARIIITIILQFYGVRRYGDKVAGRFCLSFFVTSKRLEMERFEIKPEDPYLAYWAKNLQPIYGEETYQNFCDLNRSWLAGYGLRFTQAYRKHMYHPEKGRMKRFFEWLLGGFLGDIAEATLKGILKERSLKKMRMLGPESNVVVSDNVLKFHNHDRRSQYYEEWTRRCQL